MSMFFFLSQVGVKDRGWSEKSLNGSTWRPLLVIPGHYSIQVSRRKEAKFSVE